MWIRPSKQHPSPPKANGFTLIESLTALLCASVVISLCAGVLNGLLHMSSSMQSQMRETGILQMREYAAGYDTLNVEDGVLNMENSLDSCTFSFHNGRIVRRPGYEIFLEGLENGTFYEEDGIWLEVVQNGMSSTWQIAR